jgi:hypothetical protein
MAIDTLLYRVSFFPYVLTPLIVMVLGVASGLIVFNVVKVRKADSYIMPSCSRSIPITRRPIRYLVQASCS